MRVVGYYVQDDFPVKVLLKRKKDTYQYFMLNSSFKYKSNGGVVVKDNDILNFRELFYDYDPPKKFLDKVKIIKRDDKRFPLKIINRGCVEVNESIITKRFSYNGMKEFSEFLTKDLIKRDIGKILYVFENGDKVKLNESLFTDNKKMSERDFVLKYIKPDACTSIRKKLQERFFVRQNGLYLPKEDKYFFLNFNATYGTNPFLEKDSLTAIETVILYKIIKYLAEDLCPFVTVSCNNEEQAYNALMNSIFVNPWKANIKLEFNSCFFEYCTSHIVKKSTSTNQLYRQRHPEAMIDNVDSTDKNRISLGLVVEPPLYDEAKRKYQSKGNRSVIRKVFTCVNTLLYTHRRPVMIGIKSRCLQYKYYYLCYDPTTASILCDGNNLKRLLNEKLNGIFVNLYLCYNHTNKDIPFEWYHRRLMIKPRHFDIMKSVCAMIGRRPVLSDIPNREWYEKGSVIYTNKSKRNPRKGKSTCFDFNNFYGTSLTVNNLDPFLCRISSLLVEARTNWPLEQKNNVYHRSIKQNLVSLIGIAKHHDLLTFNLIKHSCVTTCLKTIIHNFKRKSKLISVTTDGITYESDICDLNMSANNYSIKKEYSFSRYAFYQSCNKYIGWDKLGKKFISKGIVGRNFPPVISKSVNAFLFWACRKLGTNVTANINSKRDEKFRREFEKIKRKICLFFYPSEDYLLLQHPDGINGITAPRKYYPAEFVYQELCQDRLLCYANFNDYPNNKRIFNDVHNTKNSEVLGCLFQNGLTHINCCYEIDHDKYFKIFVSKLKSACDLLRLKFPTKEILIDRLYEGIIRAVKGTILKEICLAQQGTVIPGAMFNL